MANTSQAIADLPDGGILYEPRALWDVKAFELLDVPQLLPMDREHFCNTEPYPMTIERITIAPINYCFRTTPAALSFIWQSMSAVFNAQSVLGSSPFRFHFGLTPVLAGALCPMPTGQPALASPDPSSAYGLVAKNFSRRFILPKNGAIVWDLSGGNRYFFNDETSVPFDVKATMVWEELGGLWPGSARTFGPVALGEIGTAGRFPSGAVPPNPEEGWPYCIDAFAPPNQAGSNDFWPPISSFTQQKFMQQESTRQGSTQLTGMRVHLNQVDMDDALINAVGAPPGAIGLAEASTRIGCRVMTTGGGSNRDWWRPGVPLCLVMDTITPAAVYELQKPITLGPGDTLDVQLQLPALPGRPPSEPFQRMFNIGIACNGWTAIAG